MKARYPFSNPCKKSQASLRFIKQSTFGIALALALIATLMLHLIGVVHETTAGTSYAAAHAYQVAHPVSQLVDVTPNDEDPWPHH